VDRHLDGEAGGAQAAQDGVVDVEVVGPGNGGDVAPIVAVVTLPKGSSVDSPGAGRELTAALAKVKTALPHARLASYASTHDRAIVSKDGRTTFALVSIPATGGVTQARLKPVRPRPRWPASTLAERLSGSPGWMLCAPLPLTATRAVA
jgi:hypothetical protein